MNRKEKYNDFDEWETDAFRAGATQVLEVGENIFYAIRTPDNKPVQSDADGMFDLRSRRGREVMKTATTIGGWAGGSGEIYRHIVSRAGKARPYTNPKGVYTTYSAWRAAAKNAGAVRFEGDKDIAQAFDANGRGVAEWDGAEGYIYRKSEMRNPVKSRKENYTNFDDWEVDAFRAGATQVIRLGEDLFSAIKMKDGSLVKLDDEGYVDMRSRAGQRVRKESITVGAWYGDRGEIYRHLIKNNPRHRIAVRLSKSRQRNPLESGANISDDKDINFRASNMG